MQINNMYIITYSILTIFRTHLHIQTLALSFTDICISLFSSYLKINSLLGNFYIVYELIYKFILLQVRSPNSLNSMDLSLY